VDLKNAINRNWGKNMSKVASFLDFFIAFLRVSQQGDFKNTMRNWGTSMSKAFCKKKTEGGGGVEKKSKPVSLGQKQTYGRFFRVPASSRSPAWALFAKVVLAISSL
jgi:hypothetical protein